MLRLPFAVAAAKTGFPGYALEKETAEGLVPLAQKVIAQYMPKEASPHAALVVLCGTLVITAGLKTIAYLDWKQEQRVRAPKPEEFGLPVSRVQPTGPSPEMRQ